MKETGKLNTICNEMRCNDIHILGLSETNWNGNGSFETISKYTVLFAGNENGYSHGVSFILSNEIAGAVIGYNPFNNRIILVRINARPHNISIIQFYAPTSASTEEEIEEFYSQLKEVIDKIPSCDVTLIMGDANAKVGKADIPSVTYGQYGLGIRNVRGSVLIDFCATNDLVISNTCFNQHPRRLFTWTSPVDKSFQDLLRYEDQRSSNDFWQAAKDIIMDTASKTVPKKKRSRFSWISSEILKEIEKRRKIKSSGLNNPESRTAYKEQNAIVQRMMRKDKQRAIDNQCRELEEKSVTNSTKDLYKAVKDLTRKFRPATDIVKNESCELLTEGPQVKQRWKSYCENLYTKTNIRPFSRCAEMNQNDEPPPPCSEIKSAIQYLKINKVPGIDGIPAELLKKGGINVIKYFHQLCSTIWERKEWPDDWRTSFFVVLPKRGNTSECSNNRTIALISHSSKTLLKIIANQMQERLHSEIAEELAGFRPGKPIYVPESNSTNHAWNNRCFRD